MIKKLTITLLYAFSSYAYLGATSTMDEQVSLVADEITEVTKAVRIDPFKEEIRSKLAEMEEVNTILAGQVQNLLEAETKRDSNIISLRDVLISISSYRSQSVAEINELKELCKSLELRMNTQNKNAKKWALAGCLATATAFLAYEAWLYKTKMGQKTK